MSLTPYQIAATRAYDDAKKAYMDLRLDDVKEAVERLTRVIGTPRDKRDGAWLLDGIRMCMFIDCEQSNLPGVEDYIAEIETLEGMRVGEEEKRLIPKAAKAWAYAWRFELRGEHDLALARRHALCLGNREKARDLVAADGLWRFGDAAEAKLIVDGYADWIRSCRMQRQPIGTMAGPRAQLASWAHTSDFLPLVRNGWLSRWSRRRTLLRLAFEAADRCDHGVANSYIDEANAALLDKYRGKELAKLEAPLIKMELEYAWRRKRCRKPMIMGYREEALEFFDLYGFRRRRETLLGLWGLILTHEGK